MHAQFQTFIYLLAAVISVPVAKRMGLGSVLGYLLAGAIIGPAALKLVGSDEANGGEHVLHVAEFGVVLMLFLIGLELRPARLWELRRPVLGMGGLQVVVTAGAVMLIATLALHLSWRTGLAIGLILAMSSTAIVLQSLGEKGLLHTPGGEACFSVLLFQDIAVIPILAVLPLLAPGGGRAPQDGGGVEHAAAQAGAHGGNAIESLPGWAHGLVVLGAVAAVVVGGRFALRPLFRYIAKTDLREMFTATALLLVVGVALLMQLVGLSAALGTFLAGVVLADSEYRHQLEADIEPFKGLLLGLFFISVGAGIDFHYIAAHPLQTLALVAALLAVKFLVLLALGRAFGLRGNHNLLFAFALAQTGEFAFVLISFCTGQGVLSAAAASPLTAAVALSMAATPLMLIINDRANRWIQAWEERHARPSEEEGSGRAPDAVEPHDQGGVIIAGFGRFGSAIGRLLRLNGVPTTVLEHDADWVDTLREFGLKSYYGDAMREDLLRSAGIARAKLFIIGLRDKEKSLALVEMLQTDFPHLTILARAYDRIHAYELIRHGVKPEHVYRETLGTSMEVGVDALRLMGLRGTQAVRAARFFRDRDAATLRELAAIYDGDQTVFRSTARKHIENLENLFRSDRAVGGHGHGIDRGWEGAPRAARNGEAEEDGR